MATDSSIPPTIGRRAFGAARYMASAAPGTITRVEAVNVAVENGTRRIGKLANLEPGDGVQNLMQTGWDQQTVNEAEDARTHRTRRDDPLAARMDSMLHWRPDVAKDRGENQTEEAGRDWHEAFATKEAEEVWQLDVCPAVIYRTADQTGNDTRQYAHVDFRVNRYHRFRQDEVTNRPCQRCGPRTVFRPAGSNADGENQRQVVKDCAASLGDKRHVEKIGLPESQQQRCNR